MMTVRGIATMKKDLDIEVQDIMKVWDYCCVTAKKFLKPIASIRCHTRYNSEDRSSNKPKYMKIYRLLTPDKPDMPYSKMIKSDIYLSLRRQIYSHLRSLLLSGDVSRRSTRPFRPGK